MDEGYDLRVRIYLVVVETVLGVGLDFFAHPGQSVATVGGEVLGDAYLGEKVGFEGDDAFGCFATV